MKKLLLQSMLVTTGVLLVACAPGNDKKGQEDSSSTKASTTDVTKADKQLKGVELENTLTNTNWQGTRVYDNENNDLTEENKEFIGLAKYDAKTNYYEFFDKETGETRGDEGTFFITNDGEKRILISKTKNYQAVVSLTELTDKIFTYKREGKDKEGQPIEVFVEHVPYTEKELTFTNGRAEVDSTFASKLEQKTPGSEILGNTLWNGTKVLDEAGNDVTEYNQMFISLAKFDNATSQYEFFDLKTGDSRGDFGYYDVINDNTIRTHVSIGENKYGADLELTELSNERFTYKRQGKDAAGKEITIFVEHEPYTGEFKPAFTF